VDNTPVGLLPTTGTFNFFNPQCVDDNRPCAVNVKDADPGQVVQITPDAAKTVELNDYMHDQLVQYDSKTPWQFYKLVNVQWARTPVELSGLPLPARGSLPDGTPNTQTLVNAVLETFVQNDGTGCFSCHKNPKTAAAVPGAPRYAASYSFAFERATRPKSVP